MLNSLLKKILLTIVVILGISQVQADDSPEYWLQKMGFSPVGQQAIDFSLPLLSKETQELSSLKGKWIFLVFWATWCSPCREEMPTLEAISREFANANLAVRGISIDNSDSSQVLKFVKENRITFPIWHDKENRVAYQYQANSVPSLYLISPDWKLVGIMRGAKDWQDPEAISQIKELIKFNKVDVAITAPAPVMGSALPNGTSQREQIELPNNLIPPAISIKVLGNEFVVGKVIEVEVAVSWEGEARQYILKTPLLTTDEKIKHGEVFSTSSSDVSKAILRYIYPLTVTEAGTYKIGPAELSYAPREGGKELFSRASTINLVVEQSFLMRYGLMILILLILLLGGSVLLIKRRAKKKAEKKIATKLQESKILINNSWFLLYFERLSLGKKEYVCALLEFYREVVGMDISKIKAIIDEVRYAGKMLSAEEISYYEKQILKALNLNNDLEE